MNTSTVTLSNHYILQFIDIVEQAGVHTDGWLKILGIDPHKDEEAAVTMPWETFRRFLLDARQFTNERSLGLMIGSRLLINMHGVLGHAAMSGGSIRQIIELLRQYLGLRTDLITMTASQQGNQLKVSFDEIRPLGDVRAIVTEAIVLAIRNVLDFTTMGSSIIREVHFAFEGDANLAQALFRCPVSYNMESTGFSLPLESVDKPLKMANTVAFQAAVKVCKQELDNQLYEDTWSSRIRRLLLRNRQGFPTLEVTARQFHITPRTLHRRLIDEGTSYRQIIEDVRRQLALRYLETGHMTIQEIAYALGYTDVANFRKAFKRWESIPPSQYRPGT